MKKPSSLKIGHKTYRIEFVKGLAEDHGQDGHTLLNKSLIRIDADLEPLDMLETYIHEVLHAIWSDRELGYSDSAEEKIVTGLARGLTAVITENELTG